MKLTRRAAERVKEYIGKEGNPSLGLRVKAEKDECGCLSYSLALEDGPAKDDMVLKDYDLRIFVDPATADLLRGATIDYVRTSKGEGFRIGGGACGPECSCT